MKEKKIKILFFIIINLILPIIICDGECNLCNESSPTCHQNCRQSLTNGDSTYYYCNFDEIKIFYFIFNNQCFVKDKCGDNEKMIDETTECVLSCGSYYELGDFCFNEIPSNAEILSTDLKLLKCKYKYHITQAKKSTIA